MAGSKQAAALIAAVLSVTSVSVPAEANRRCGYDRYGYNAPDFSGCYRYYREGRGFGPAYVPLFRGALRRACAPVAGESFVDFQQEQGTRRIVDRAFGALNLSRKTVLEVGDVQVLLALVARGFGIALVPRTLANARASANAFPKIGIAELKRPELRWELVVAYHGRSGMAQSRNPAVAAFTAVLSKVRDDGRLA